MIADVVIVLDEGADLPFEISGQVVVVEQDVVLQGLVPALDLSLGLGTRCWRLRPSRSTDHAAIMLIRRFQFTPLVFRRLPISRDPQVNADTPFHGRTPNETTTLYLNLHGAE